MFPYGEREDQVRVWLRSVAGCGSNGQKNSVNRRLFTFYTSNNRCGKSCQVLATKKPKFRFRGELYSDYFPSSYTIVLPYRRDMTLIVLKAPLNPNQPTGGSPGASFGFT